MLHPFFLRSCVRFFSLSDVSCVVSFLVLRPPKGRSRRRDCLFLHFFCRLGFRRPRRVPRGTQFSVFFFFLSLPVEGDSKDEMTLSEGHLLKEALKRKCGPSTTTTGTNKSLQGSCRPQWLACGAAGTLATSSSKREKEWKQPKKRSEAATPPFVKTRVVLGFLFNGWCLC